MIPQKRQAFVQLPDVTSAANLVTFYQTRDALIRGKKIFFEFSNRNEITVRSDNDAPPYQQQQARQQPPQNAAPYQQQPSSMGYAPRQDMPPYRGDGGGTDAMAMALFGNVEKIVTFWKDNEFKALVQMESVDQAQAAQSALDGRDIYTGCNQLSIVFSRHPELRVRYNDDRSRDYTNPNLPPGPGRGGVDDHGENNPVNSTAAERRDVPRDSGYNNNPPSRRDDLPYREATDAPNLARGDQYAPGVRDGRGPPSRFDERPPSMDRPRDVRGGRELPPHSTGRAIRGDTRPSPALICSNIDCELVVSVAALYWHAVNTSLCGLTLTVPCQ
ncbi:unnamed protein product [Phytophthora lilii]|uniref:Unnamed protein product n=1 Tax=Phytophthora lilii TaxID=2077276 RepID=A0A9W6TGD1_9STRA|nr:unnamed protein product [Phytophthora lilii]